MTATPLQSGSEAAPNTARAPFAPKPVMLKAAEEIAMDGQSEQKLVRLEQGQEEIRDESAAHGGLLRTLLERADEIIRLLTPAPSDGPTLEELLAQMVSMLNDHSATLKRLDVRSDRQERELPLDVVTALMDHLGPDRAAQS